MKNILLATALVFAGSAAVAADFDNTGVNLVLERDNLTFGIDTNQGEATDLSFGVAVLAHSVAGADADVTLGATYNIQDEDFSLSAKYGLSKHFNRLNVYGSVEAAYMIASGANAGTWEATPAVGAAYHVNDQLIAFSEVSYTWDVSNDWSRNGGEVEVGARYAINDDVAITPSIVRSFDTGADETNVNLALGLRF